MPPVTLVSDESMRYPREAPFHPDRAYPELVAVDPTTGGPNSVYDGVRKLLATMRLDSEHVGTARWNPFGGLLRAGGRVFIKPNLVLEEREHTVGTQCVVTHASVLRPIIDYCLLATAGDVSILVGDVPLQCSDFERTVRDNGLRELVDYFAGERGIDIRLLDLRPFRQEADESFFFSEMVAQRGDPRGYSTVDLAGRSWLEPLCDGRSPKFTVTDYDAGETRIHHTRGFHEYSVCNSALEADLFINVPKLKSHEKAGLTVNLKNLVGINGQKSWLPHFRKGSRAVGGDEWNQRSLRRALHSRARAVLQGRSERAWRAARWVWRRVRPRKNLEGTVTDAVEFFETGGAWHGNDTVWRMVLDLNAIILRYSMTDGWLDDCPRNYLFVVDGVVAGENQGPLFPQPRPLGLLLGGFNPLDGDLVAARAVGFDWRKIPLLRGSFDDPRFKLSDFAEPESIEVLTPTGRVSFADLQPLCQLVPAPGWRGHIEARPGDAREVGSVR